MLLDVSLGGNVRSLLHIRDKNKNSMKARKPKDKKPNSNKENDKKRIYNIFEERKKF